LEDGGMMDKGGKTKDEPKVIRGYSDDEAYEYAKGGLTQHGLKQGDMIMGHSDNNVVVKDKSNKIYIININNGTRLSEEEFEKFSSREKTKFSKMAHGGHVMSKTHRISK
jgi:outer membrane protein assembly factor BamB